MLPFLTEMLTIDHKVFGVIAKLRQKCLQLAVKLRRAHWPYAEKVKDRVSKETMR
jgi:hypothetical protein